MMSILALQLVNDGMNIKVNSAVIEFVSIGHTAHIGAISEVKKSGDTIVSSPVLVFSFKYSQSMHI